ncbi:uncharacterized protein N7469_001662 [Penicillium citrinum]|uniref:NAD(P)-binding domain-containing protein n=1 Tax=Penicillium citrinum TaxID=5077 RepID=A0A9W9PEW9_PENCI|nr:uncharacterized protein N7469_001662 [Penicillium citrinum]KAJ5243335.1 hypothetical protein N7469_001662 [Penicillium citrinum]
MAPQYAKNQSEGFINAIQNVAIVGTTGQIGKLFTEHLLKSGNQTMTALTRSGSETTLPHSVNNNSPVDYNDEATLMAALKDQDFLVITLSFLAPPDTHSKLVRAAVMAAAGRYLANMKEIEELGASWIGLPPNFWYEYSLGVGPFTYGFDFPNSAVTFYDERTMKINTTTWPQCGRALAALVNVKRLPEDENDHLSTLAQFCNQPVYISSFTLTQREMFDIENKLLNRTDNNWKISYQNTAERYKEGLKELKNGDGTGFLKAMYARVFDPVSGGTFETHNAVLGLPKENLDEATLSAHSWSISQAKR